MPFPLTVDVPSVADEQEAKRLMFHHLALASAYFEATPSTIGPVEDSFFKPAAVAWLDAMEALCDDNPEWSRKDFAQARPASEVIGPAAAKALVRADTSGQQVNRVELARAIEGHSHGPIRQLYERSAGGIPVASCVGTECGCGEGFSGSDIDEVRSLWAEHVAAALQPSTNDEVVEAVARRHAKGWSDDPWWKPAFDDGNDETAARLREEDCTAASEILAALNLTPSLQADSDGVEGRPKAITEQACCISLVESTVTVECDERADAEQLLEWLSNLHFGR